MNAGAGSPPEPEDRNSMKSFKTAFIVSALLALVLVPAVAAPEVFKIDPVHSQVGFTIRHIVSRVPGHFGTFSGEITLDPESLAASKVTAEIDASSVSTGNDKRDGHLKSEDFFDAAKFPKITFVSTGVTAASKDHAAVAGNLTMHGVTKPVTLDVTVNGVAPFMGAKRAGFEAKTKLNRKDFGIIWNKVLDAGSSLLGDEVEITLLIEAGTPPPEKPADAKPAAGAKPADAKPTDAKPAETKP